VSITSEVIDERRGRPKTRTATAEPQMHTRFIEGLLVASASSSRVAKADTNFVPILYPSELIQHDRASREMSQPSRGGLRRPQSTWLITRRSQVQILPPLLKRPRKAGPFVFCFGTQNQSLHPILHPEGFQNAGSCCGAVVFVDQSAESVATFDFSTARRSVRVGRVGREQREPAVRALAVVMGGVDA
jgi:hypothetical protein